MILFINIISYQDDGIKLIKETKISGYNDIKQKIIKDGRKQYYLIDNKLYKVKKDKTQGDLFGSYLDGKIIEGVEETTNLIIVKGKKSKSKNNKEVNIIKNNDEILTESKINIISDKLNYLVMPKNEPEIKVKKIIKKKVKNNTDIERVKHINL